MITIILTFGTSVFLTRLLGVEGKGEFTIFTSSLGLFGLLFSFGSRPAIVYYCVRDEIHISKLFTTSILFSLVIGSVFFLLMHTVQNNSTASIFLHNNRSTLFYEVLLTICLTLTMFSSLLKSIFNSKKKFRHINLFQLAAAIIGLITYGILYFGNGGFWNIPLKQIFLIFTVICVLNFLIVVIAFFKSFKITPTYTLLSRGSLSKLIGFASLAYLGNVAQFLNYRIDLWLVDYFSGAFDLGLYSLSANLAQMLWVLPQSIAMVLFPYFAANSEEILPKTLMIGRTTLFICLIVSIISFLTMDYFIVMLYGIEFKTSALLFNILLLGVIPFSLTVIYGSYFSGMKKQEINMFAAFIGLVATIVLDWLWIPKYGNIGAAIATSCSYVITTSFIIAKLRSTTNASFKDIFLFKYIDYKFLKEKLLVT